MKPSTAPGASAGSESCCSQAVQRSAEKALYWRSSLAAKTWVRLLPSRGGEIAWVDHSAPAMRVAMYWEVKGALRASPKAVAEE